MKSKFRFDTQKLKGKLGKMRDWMTNHHFPPRVMFFILGIASTIWFLIRVIPKPTRATYPCMQVAAPIMSGFVMYLLSLGGITLAVRRAHQNMKNLKFLKAGVFIFIALMSLGVAVYVGSNNSYSQDLPKKMGPDDGPNQPVGKPTGYFPGRVVWIWNPEATNENCKSNFQDKDYYFLAKNMNKQVISDMLVKSVTKLSGKATVKDSWDSFFKNLNKKKYGKEKGYTKGEKIFVKINQGTARWLLTQEDKNNGYYFPQTIQPDPQKRAASIAPLESNPYTTLEVLRQLIEECGIDQADITVGDPMTDIYGHNYDVWHAAYPNVIYVDKFSTMHGRTMIHPTEKDLLFYSDKTQSDKLYDCIENANYLVNVANFKPHVWAGISLTAKNHFGSQARPTAGHLHYSLMGPRGGNALNGGYHKYRVQVDLMGSKYLGQNTVLYIVDGLFGGGASETKPPVRYYMAPFNNDWCNSFFVSLDQVALESVCYDFLRTEWNGVNKHDPINNNPEFSPSYNGVDDYLHQAADPANWPKDITYDPDGTNKPLKSMGIHEHWNNPVNKQYSRNLGLNKGIELVAIPDTLISKK
jgi:hypothetical protein